MFSVVFSTQVWHLPRGSDGAGVIAAYDDAAAARAALALTVPLLRLHTRV